LRAAYATVKVMDDSSPQTLVAGATFRIRIDETD